MMASCFIFLLQITWTILLVLVNIKMSKQQTIRGFFVSNAANSSRTGNISGSAAGKPAIANVNDNVQGNDKADDAKSNDIEFETIEDRPIPDDVGNVVNILVDNNNNDESMSK